jgi:hypothetical protein
MGSVNIELANGGLGGTLQTEDGIVGMVMTGGIDDAGYVLGTPILVTGLAGVAAEGISTSGNNFAMRQLTDFYKTAGDGAQLYLMLVPNSLTVADMADEVNENGAKKLLDYAQGKIKVLGIMTDETAIDTPVIEDGFNVDTFDGLENLQGLCEAYTLLQQPLRGVIGVGSYTGISGDLADLTGFSYNRVAALIGDTKNSECAALGLLMGSIAKHPVMRKVSRVKNGAVRTTTAYVGSVAVGDVGADVDVIASKGFITWKQYSNVSGFYWSGDPMATVTTDDYAFMVRGRVIDKAHRLAYLTFVQEVDDEVLINTDGTLDAGYCKHLERIITNQINNTMTANAEISSVQTYVNPAQNVLSTNRVAIVLGVIPVGYATVINVTLGFRNPANE